MPDIVTAAPMDLAQVRRINALLRIDVDDFYWDTTPYLEAAILENRCFLIREKQSIMGCMILERRGPAGPFRKDHLAIGTLSILPECREENCGARLVEFAKAMARKEGKRLYVESFYAFRNAGFYRALGFTEAAPKVYKGEPYHVLYVDP